MKTSELKRLLRKAGCYKKMEGGNHELWYSPATGKTFPVPRHDAKEIARGTLEKIMKDAGLK